MFTGVGSVRRGPVGEAVSAMPGLVSQLGVAVRSGEMAGRYEGVGVGV